jgi:hypothetical protein
MFFHASRNLDIIYPIKETAMPDSITVAAFVIGLVFLIAALIGKELKIAAVEMPALNSKQRVIVGVLGVVLVIFGLTDGKGLGRQADPESAEATPPAAASAPAADPAPTNPGEEPTQASLESNGAALPPEFAGNIRSAKASYGCGILLGVVSNNEEQLSVCGLMPDVPEEWVTKARHVNIDCATTASDRIIVEVWTGANYSGEKWGYSFGCP